MHIQSYSAESQGLGQVAAVIYRRPLHPSGGLEEFRFALTPTNRELDEIDSLTDAKAAGNLSRRLRVLTHPELHVLDEIGYLFCSAAMMLSESIGQLECAGRRRQAYLKQEDRQECLSLPTDPNAYPTF